jgi:hypothetical protein
LKEQIADRVASQGVFLKDDHVAGPQVFLFESFPDCSDIGVNIANDDLLGYGGDTKESEF